MNLKNLLFELTPLGKSDKEVQNYLEGRISKEEMARYRDSLKQYRHMKLIESSVKLLFYASLLTALAATLGIGELRIIQRIASYLGTSVIFVLFAVSSYFTMVKRESYHVQREILIAKAATS
ncbi:MAG: hypothetical protein ABEJ98_00090 [Candidatus Nanohaloarchaea archaeon]